MSDEWSEWLLIEKRDGSWGGETRRLKVPGGWLYSVIEKRGTDEPVMGLTFVPEAPAD